MHKRVEVAVRIRPTVSGVSGISVNESEKTILVTHQGNGTAYTFDGIFGERTSQEQIFRGIMGVTDSVVEGYNGTILAYGQTGAGKTFTMTGKTSCFNDRGICPRAISHIFKATQRIPDCSMVIRVSYIQIYNEQVFDLLESNENAQNAKDLVVQETKEGETIIRGCSTPIVPNEEAALNLLFEGETNRIIAGHSLNSTSTRSHCIFTIHVEKRPLDSSNGTVVRSKLNIVDLAGSERMKKTMSSGNTLKEAMYINKSLTFLEQVVIALGDRRREHIPYRQTMLTNILKDSLGGNCRTVLIACIWTDAAHTDQTTATLKFATRMMRVKTSPVVNVVEGSSEQSKIYKQEIDLLKQELSLYDALAGKSYVTSNPLSHQEKHELRDRVRQYIGDPLQEIEMTSVRQIREIFNIFRTIIIDDKNNDITRNDTPKVKTHIQKNEEISPNEISHPGLRSSLNVGLANVMQSPAHDTVDAKRFVTSPEIAKVTNLKDDEKAFLEYRSAAGAQTDQQYQQAKANLAKAKLESKRLAAEVNAIKSEIDSFRSKAECDDMTDEQLVQLKTIKKKYRVRFEEHSEAQAEVKYLHNNKEQSFKALVRGFEEWRKQQIAADLG